MVVQPRPAQASSDEDATWEHDIFLSYNRRDRAAVERLAVALRERGLRVFKDDWYLRPGEHWPTALEKKLVSSAGVVIAFGRHGLGPWQQREATAALELQSQARKAGRSVPPVVPLLLDEGSDLQAGLMFLLQNVWVEAWDPRAPDLIVGTIAGKAPAELYSDLCPDPRWQICPYRGLQVFREEDANFYFGREPDLKRVLEAIDRHPIAAVVGPSGSGKSSLVRAGLFPQLRQATRGKVWQPVSMVPGNNPFRALASQLLPLREPECYVEWSKADIDDQCDRLRTRLEHDGADHLTRVVEQILEEVPGTTDLLLLVDQWEELYIERKFTRPTEYKNSEQQRRFVDMLLEVVEEAPVKVVLTLRADYWSEVLNDALLSSRLPDSAIIHLRALDRQAIAEIIHKPAELVGLHVPDALGEALLNEAAGQPGELPLLEFTLQRLWNERSRAGSGALSLNTYRSMGGLKRAIIGEADKLLDRLAEHERNAVPGLLAALIQVGEQHTDLRRRALLAELSPAAQAVARQFVNARLLVTSRDWTSGNDLVEVAHEALLRHWPKLGAWIDARRDALRTVRQLQADCHTWLSRDKDPSYLWSHERVREAVAAVKQLSDELVLNDEERCFLGPIDPTTMLTELEHTETTHRRRAMIGERLNTLGDPRSGVGLGTEGDPDIVWCPIAGGSAAIEILDDPSDLTSKIVARQSRRLSPFSIARNPITVAQYQAFLMAEDGWRDPVCWGEDLFRATDGDSQEIGACANHPAVYVSWFEAMAFCRWLGHRSGETITLPDEWQWQHAATNGNRANKYPWGTAWDAKLEAHRANSFESYLGAAVAVGMYPAGRSSAGTMDMAGNVWEWCLNKFDPPDEAKPAREDFASRALRGGSWSGNQNVTRCTTRTRILAHYRSFDVGFRVVRLSNK